jgi:hypothetical protein
MKRAIAIALIAIGVLTIILYIPIWLDDAQARQNRGRVNNLIKVGQDLGDAELILKDAGFRLMYEQAIAPTVNKDYLLQMVTVGETRPNAFESFAYAAQLSWMPFTHSESPYVGIHATLDGKITEIR